MACKWIEHKNRKIMFQDFRGLNKEEMLAAADEAARITEEINEKICVLIDIRDTSISDEFINKAKEIGTRSKDKIRKSAIIGIYGIQQMLFNTFGPMIGIKDFKAFDNEEAAKNYLTS